MTSYEQWLVETLRSHTGDRSLSYTAMAQHDTAGVVMRLRPGEGCSATVLADTVRATVPLAHVNVVSSLIDGITEVVLVLPKRDMAARRATTLASRAALARCLKALQVGGCLLMLFMYLKDNVRALEGLKEEL